MNMVASAPVAIAIDASDAMMSYVSGVFTGPCSNNPDDSDHAVTLVGYQQDQPGLPGYWIIRNSWNTDWGEKGFIRIAMANNACTVQSWAFSVAV